jgi:hypothetical protein
MHDFFAGGGVIAYGALGLRASVALTLRVNLCDT